MDVVILLVEDEGPVREVVFEILTAEGWVVHQAEHADAALAILEIRCSEIHVLLTDVNMPGSMDGVALAHHVHRHWPAIGLVIASGRPKPKADALPPGARFLPKPWRRSHMLRHVRELTAAA
jgi:DNA-binding NtrC family response regulator